MYVQYYEWCMYQRCVHGLVVHIVFLLGACAALYPSQPITSSLLQYAVEAVLVQKFHYFDKYTAYEAL